MCAHPFGRKVTVDGGSHRRPSQHSVHTLEHRRHSLQVPDCMGVRWSWSCEHTIHTSQDHCVRCAIRHQLRHFHATRRMMMLARWLARSPTHLGRCAQPLAALCACVPGHDDHPHATPRCSTTRRVTQLHASALAHAHQRASRVRRAFPVAQHDAFNNRQPPLGGRAAQ